MEAQWYADRTRLRALLRAQPTWTLQDYADATQRSLGWVKKWGVRLRSAAPDDEPVLHSQSRARRHPPPRLDPRVIARLRDIRAHPPDHLHRIPAPKAILYYLARDATLQVQGLRLPRSTRTVWQILRQWGRIPTRIERRHTPVERPAPMGAGHLDFKDVTTVPAEPDGTRQPVVDVRKTVAVGSAILVQAQVREDFTAETTLQASVDTLRAYGLPEHSTLDRDPRFVARQQQRDVPGPLVRLCHVLGVQVTICPPRRPDKHACAERYHRTSAYACLRVFAPPDVGTVRAVTARFHSHSNVERPNQAVSCRNQPPCLAFPDLPTRPPLPAVGDPDRWVDVLDGQRYARKVRRDGTVKGAGRGYYIDQPRAGSYVSRRSDAAQRSVVAEAGEQPIKAVPITGLVGEPLPLEVYLEQVGQEARNDLVVGRPIGQPLRRM